MELVSIGTQSLQDEKKKRPKKIVKRYKNDVRTADFSYRDHKQGKKKKVFKSKRSAFLRGKLIRARAKLAAAAMVGLGGELPEGTDLTALPWDDALGDFRAEEKRKQDEASGSSGRRRSSRLKDKPSPSPHEHLSTTPQPHATVKPNLNRKVKVEDEKKRSNPITSTGEIAGLSKSVPVPSAEEKDTNMSYNHGGNKLATGTDDIISSPSEESFLRAPSDNSNTTEDTESSVEVPYVSTMGMMWGAKKSTRDGRPVTRNNRNLRWTTAPGRKTWTEFDDAELTKLINIHGPSAWTKIAEAHVAITRRACTPKQCRERYHNHLQSNIRKGDWTEEEDRLIMEMQFKLGNQWARIAKMLEGRTDHAVKNRWFAQTRRMYSRLRPLVHMADKAMSSNVPKYRRDATKYAREDYPLPPSAQSHLLPRAPVGDEAVDGLAAIAGAVVATENGISDMEDDDDNEGSNDDDSLQSMEES